MSKFSHCVGKICAGNLLLIIILICASLSVLAQVLPRTPGISSSDIKMGLK